MCTCAGSLLHMSDRVIVWFSLHVSSLLASDAFRITFTPQRKDKIHPGLWKVSNGKPIKAIDEYQLNENENVTDRQTEPSRG